MFPLLNYALQRAVLADEVGHFPLILNKDCRGTTIQCSSFYSEVPKHVHSNEAHILLPTFPAGQIRGKKWIRRARKSVWFVEDPTCSGINRQTCISTSIGLYGSFWASEEVTACRADGCAAPERHLILVITAPMDRGSYLPSFVLVLCQSIHLTFSWVLFLGSKSDTLLPDCHLAHGATFHRPTNS